MRLGTSLLSFVIMLFSALTVSASPRALQSSLATPAVRGPIQGGLRGRPWATTVEKLAPLSVYDYSSEEFFFSGEAQKRNALGTVEGHSENYTARMLVHRPRNPANFNGTVFVEWMNVTVQAEIPMLWTELHKEVVRQGYAYAAISVQQVGVSLSPFALKIWDPIRYQDLHQPGDQYADDIFGQAAKALLNQNGVRPLGDLKVSRLIAGGLSQSASLLGAYVNNVHSQHQVYDGFFVDGWPTPIRADVDVPVLMLSSETEIEGMTSPLGLLSEGSLATHAGALPTLAFLKNHPPKDPSKDHSSLRVWEVAGAAHFDEDSLYYLTAELTNDLTAPADLPLFFRLPGLCFKPLNRLAVASVARAGLRQLNNWIRDGVAPLSLPRIQRDSQKRIARSTDEMPLGGIRLPAVEAPLGVNKGAGCLLFGSYQKFSTEQINALYKNQTQYVNAVKVSALKNWIHGTLTEYDAEDLVQQAKVRKIR